jgi:hypothetical protein
LWTSGRKNRDTEFQPRNRRSGRISRNAFAPRRTPKRAATSVIAAGTRATATPRDSVRDRAAQRRKTVPPPHATRSHPGFFRSSMRREAKNRDVTARNSDRNIGLPNVPCGLELPVAMRWERASAISTQASAERAGRSQRLQGTGSPADPPETATASRTDARTMFRACCSETQT